MINKRSYLVLIRAKKEVFYRIRVSATGAKRVKDSYMFGYFRPLFFLATASVVRATTPS